MMGNDGLNEPVSWRAWRRHRVDDGAGTIAAQCAAETAVNRSGIGRRRG